MPFNDWSVFISLSANKIVVIDFLPPCLMDNHRGCSGYNAHWVDYCRSDDIHRPHCYNAVQGPFGDNLNSRCDNRTRVLKIWKAKHKPRSRTKTTHHVPSVPADDYTILDTHGRDVVLYSLHVQNYYDDHGTDVNNDAAYPLLHLLVDVPPAAESPVFPVD